MKTDKEYPATHSMSTAWYIVDQDGNVGIMDYNDNGPVPWCTEQTCIENLVFGHKVDDRKDFLPINLTDDQVLELIEKPKDPDDNEDTWWFWETVVQIDMTQEKEFLALIKNPDVVFKHCISKTLGIYMLDCHRCFLDKREATHKHPLKSSSLYKMLASNMILKLYMPKDYYISDEWKGDHMEYEHTFGASPYYIYAQPYWNEILAERISIPKNPVKLEQLPTALQRRVHRIPVKFEVCMNFQIAESTPCSFNYDDDIIIDGCRYSLLPKTDGGKAYFLEDLHMIDFYSYCSEKEKYHCEYCTINCTRCHEHVFTDQPTVMIVVSPYSKFDYGYMETSDIIIKKSIMLPYLPMIPRPLGMWPLIEDAKKDIKVFELEKLYLSNYHYLEDMLRRYNPQVVIADSKAFNALKKRYDLTDNNLDVGWKKYPFYRSSNVNGNRKEIERLATLPYQGKVFPRIISVEDMQKLTQKKND